MISKIKASTKSSSLCWPPDVAEVQIPSSDGTTQPSLWYAGPPGNGARPLLVALHTWSANYKQTTGQVYFAKWCQQLGWAFLHPNFRGPNNSPEALGSSRAVQDVLEAVEWAKLQTHVDLSRIYLAGASGGGYMSLLMAGRHPEIWAAVSSWCPIVNVGLWYREHVKGEQPDRYARDIEMSLGGAPDSNREISEDAGQRSPTSWLKFANDLPLDINAGIHDGRKGSVPFHHALLAFNATQPPKNQLSTSDIETYYQTQKLPRSWESASEDPVYGQWKPRFRKISGKTRVTIFEGAHEIVHQAAIHWLGLQRKGQKPVWNVDSFKSLQEVHSQVGS